MQGEGDKVIQPMRYELDAVYTAGLMDGDGCIVIARHSYPHATKRAYYQLQVTVGSTDFWLLQWLKLTWGGAVTESYKGHTTNFGVYSKDFWCWQIYARKAYNLLKAILPYLKSKKGQAEIAIQFQQARLAKGQRVTNEKLALDEEYRVKISQLNKN